LTSSDTVLLVDDEPAVLRALSRFLREQGLDVAEATDGRSAIQRLEQGGIGAIVSDIHMPDVDGIQLLRAIRERDLDLPVILMTAAPQVATATRAVEYGAMRYLTKPLDLGELAKTVQYAVHVQKMAMLKRAALAHLGVDGALAADRAGLEARWDAAVERVWMAYQPLVDSRTRTLYGFEALVRSHEPSLSNPSALLATAERLAQLPRLTQAIHSRVAAAMAALPDSRLMFVNLHPQDLMNDALFSTAAALYPHASRIVLEITERSSLETIPDVRGRVHALRGLGFRLAVDDLGAGYAGLASVVQLQPEIIKFDVALVRDIDREPTKQKLLRSMIELCHDMGIVATAEGVETPNERDTLIALGCDVLQGYLIGRPAPAFSEPTWAI
jgi:EAL domain-containing protein (putative c-di-GMP-specific phosphodiesterase class I)